ncbi:MAG: UDP-3-O-(3-hydroxymyristoyl)glucosamine N-acyltransferase [Bacteroidales bacterium]|nr:UDP-3-O-(3-hydroxymyristoyl)glucosamine N-acyltransferase [Bacteroidales bacterium]
MEFTAAQIASFLSGTVEGNPEAKVSTFTKIEEGKPGGLSFLSNPKYTHYIYDTEASIVLVNKDFVAEKPVTATLIRVDNAYASLSQLLMLVEQYKPRREGIDKDAFIADSAKIGEKTYVGHYTVVEDNAQVGDACQIYPQVYIGERVRIGRNCLIYPGVKIYHDCVIGDNCTLHAGVVIGGDGFGFAPQADGSYKKIPQIGNVVLEDDVEICANTTIDRATMGSTVIHKGVKIDNLVQVAHNVEIGEHTVMAAQVGVAGSSKLGKHCTVAGQVGIAGHLHVADGTTLAAQAGIISDVTDNSSPYFGTPCLPVKQYLRSYSVFKKMPELQTEIHQMRKELNELKNKQAE